MFRVLFLQVSILALALASSNPILSNSFIESINQQQSLWTAKRNFPEDTPIEHLKHLAGSIPPTEEFISRSQVRRHNVSAYAIPDSFDARTQWPKCSCLNEIRNQGHCGSCWAFASAESMTDRICIHSDGDVNFQFSPEDLLECCSDCYSIDGCAGGTAARAWEYWVTKGVVSGGDVNSNSGCKPYRSESFDDGDTVSCSQSCSNGADYNNEKHFGANYYHVEQDVEQIQIEIMTNGPIQSHFRVYDDFYSYDTGVYTHVSGDYKGGHAIKIIGWGTENSTPYWLVANSWGADWGGLGGFFKILRGENHIEIEQFIYAGLPHL